MAGASRAPAERWGKNTITMVLYCLAGAPGAAADRQGIVLLSSVHRVRENLREGKGTDGVLQVDGKARKKIQVSAHLIWSPAVEYSRSAFFSLPCGLLFHIFEVQTLATGFSSPKATPLWQS